MSNRTESNGRANPAGAVPYNFEMGKFEVSRDMITKASTAGGLGISLHNMSFVGGPRDDMPATGVSWNEAARFVNWLNTSQDFPAAYKFSSQPGDVGYNANVNISLWESGDAGFNAANPFRNSLARYVLPTADEWYKAAFHDASAGTAGTYFNYPTGSDTPPQDVASGTTFGTAVYKTADGPADITQAGGLSPYGTMGQGGNVFELEETAFDLMNSSGSSSRGWRGGDWNEAENVLSVSGRFDFGPASNEGFSTGFRVASVPEPSSFLLLSAAFLGMSIGRRMCIGTVRQ